MYLSRHIQFLISSFLIIGSSWIYVPGEGKKGKCKVCKDLVESFEKRFTETENSNYAGGDTSWEEEKLGSYANSEVRLIEILDGVCRSSDYECNRLLEHHEEDIERWWFKLRRSEDKKDLEKWLCFQHLDLCCPENTYGPDCAECPGGTEEPCGGHGKCEGAEEKDGSGKCKCDGGYEGTTCESCDTGYYLSNDTDEENFTCKVCDRSCKDACEGPGPENCEECASGYEENEDGVCKDIDECKRNESICSEGTYCLNLPGRHKCNACDKSCKHVCNGPGPSKCAECAKGYSRDTAGICKDENECEEPSICEEGTYCENSAGSYICKACHISCLVTCTGPGADGCDECKDGYTRENETCIDVDECLEDVSCDNETEVCHNLAGTFVCRCKQGLFKTDDGRCVTEEPVEEKKEKKKKKKKKKKTKKGKTSVKPSEEEEAMEKERGGEREKPTVPSQENQVVDVNSSVESETEMTPDLEPIDKESSGEGDKPALLSDVDTNLEQGGESPSREPTSNAVETGEAQSGKSSGEEVEGDKPVDTNTSSGTVNQGIEDSVVKDDQFIQEVGSNQEEHDEL